MKLPATRQRDVIGALERADFALQRWHGSHAILSRGGHEVVVPKGRHGGLHPITLRLLVKAAGLSEEQFVRYLRREG